MDSIKIPPLVLAQILSRKSQQKPTRQSRIGRVCWLGRGLIFTVLAGIPFIGLVFLYLFSVNAVKRVHDFNFRGWWLFLFAPLAVLLLFILSRGEPIAHGQGAVTLLGSMTLFLALIPGTHGENRFGAAPAAKAAKQGAVASSRRFVYGPLAVGFGLAASLFLVATNKVIFSSQPTRDVILRAADTNAPGGPAPAEFLAGADTNAAGKPSANADRSGPTPAVAKGKTLADDPYLGLGVDFQGLKARAEAGDAVYQESLGNAYCFGQGVTQDLAEAVKWYLKAAEQGNARCQCRLGWCYYSGQGVRQDYTEALKWSREAAEQGYAGGQCNLGVSYEKGQGVPQDYTEAVKWLRKAAEQGYASGQYNLGVCYRDGQGVPQDYTQSVKWFQKAAEQGDADGQWNLGWCYEHGRGVPQDYAEAVKWYRKAAEQGSAVAQNNLGVYYSDGQGVPHDYTEAVKWFRKAADQGYAIGQLNLGRSYFAGHGVPQVYTEAVKWLRKAAEQGEAEAQSCLGSILQTGTGAPQDYAEAYKWYNLAAAQNATCAIQYRDFLAKSMTPSQIEEGQRLSREFVPRKEGGAASGANSQDSVAVGNGPRFTGTGFFVTDDGYLLTAEHVVADAARVASKYHGRHISGNGGGGGQGKRCGFVESGWHIFCLTCGVESGGEVGRIGFYHRLPKHRIAGFCPQTDQRRDQQFDRNAG